jgi:NADH:ubiquinone reductase (H+-translocating)
MTSRQLHGPRRVPPSPRAGSITGGMLAGLVLWLALPLTLLSSAPGRTGVAGTVPGWSVERASALFPLLVACLVAGGALGPVIQMAPRYRLARRRAAMAAAGRRVVILGGGFGGVAAARRFEQLWRHAPGLDVTLVSKTNYLLFTPMLAEVAAGSLQPSSIGASLRAICPRTRIARAEVAGLDVEARVVHVRTAAGIEPLPYDHLVVALGAVADVGVAGVKETALPLKTLGDAVRLREHVLTQLEQADLTADPEERGRLLTFVVAGGGFAGVEGIAGIISLVRSVLGYYPRIRRDEPRFMLIHSRDRILPDLGPELGGYAREKLDARGVEVRLDARVVAATGGAVALDNGELLPTRTLVWTTGNRPSPALAELPLARDRGALRVDETLRVGAVERVWAVGDCARVPDLELGGYCPPTAQHAMRQGKAVADNVLATMTGRKAKPFRFATRGLLVALGHQTAAAELRRLRVRGLPGWVLWRALYLSKLPGSEKRVRVLLDWLVGFAFPRDTTLASELPAGTRQPAGASVPVGMSRSRRGRHARKRVA